MVVSFVNGLLTKLQKAPCNDMKRKRRLGEAEYKRGDGNPPNLLQGYGRGDGDWINAHHLSSFHPSRSLSRIS